MALSLGLKSNDPEVTRVWDVTFAAAKAHKFYWNAIKGDTIAAIKAGGMIGSGAEHAATGRKFTKRTMPYIGSC